MQFLRAFRTFRRPSRRALRLVPLAVACALAACEFRSLNVSGAGSLTIGSDDDGSMRAWVERAGYSLHVESSGDVDFTDDETDVARIDPDGEFELRETIDGVEHEYEVDADGSGRLARKYSRDGDERAFDDEAKRWLAAALPRMLRETGFDAAARVERLLARGGPETVLGEVDLMRSDYARASYLGRLLRESSLEGAYVDRALAAAERIDSDFEMRRVLGAALAAHGTGGMRVARLLEASRTIDSDFELSSLLVDAAPCTGGDAAARAAWLAAARTLDSDFELRRSLQAGLAHGDDPFAAALVALAAERMDSDFELRTVLKSVSARADDPELACAYLAAARTMRSDFERRTVLLALAGDARLDVARLALALDAVAEMSSDFEQRNVLEALAPQVAADPELNARYREIARELSSFERGRALSALDDALRG